MNKLKFRAWYKEGNAMYYDCLPLGGWDHWWIAFNNDKKYDGEFEVGKDIEVMQFTGMKDKNGVEIYDGDIVHLLSNDGIDYNALIQFIDGGFCATDGIDDYSCRRYGLSQCDLDIEVSGNVHQNTDLLY